MYSLYRSWLSREPPPLPLPVHLSRDPLSLPDVVVAVGEGPAGVGAQQFAAHRAVLSANSGYFKAALGSLESSCTCVSVSGVAADAFAPLLAFMYTGYLDLSGDNIYGVLLATHYLHMPRALELCWNFLRAHQPRPQSLTPTLVKPIPSRNKPVPVLPWRGSPTHMVLPTAEHSPFRSLQPFLPAASAPSAPQPEPPPEPPQPLACNETPQAEKDDAAIDTADSALNQSPPQPHAQPPEPTPALSPMASGKSTTGGKVVIDVACCDGPVRFHRVLNSSYGSVANDFAGPADENQLHQGMHVPGAAQLRRARLNKTQSVGDASDAGEYTCLYCNHTFKSHYCYQKHARRHLNPLVHRQAGPGASVQPPGLHRAPARPLDMNVQYYPCKTCGSKFPSYYFVHKHRKLCHAGEENDAPPSAPPSAASSSPSPSS